ncbi:MAG: hypothetical protein KAR24_00595 [Candidatus Pacebacteria bacterium]|nr:hypothetical protein [Candidatus Paceibacterota bacterium]
MNKEIKKDKIIEQQSLSGKDFLVVLGSIIIIGVLWALLVSFIPEVAYVAFFIVMFFSFILGPIFYFRKKWIKGDRIKRNTSES